MTKLEFLDLVSKVSYKPGFSTSAQEEKNLEAYRVTTVGEVDCSLNPSTRIKISYGQMIPISSIEFFTDRAAKYWFHNFFMKMEEHEVGEWLAFDKERPFDPHKERPNETRT